MIYRGRVRNGVVEFDRPVALAEGTVVSVQAADFVERAKPAVDGDRWPPRGSAEAISRHAGIWADSADEFDRLLAELKQSKVDELAAETDESL